MTCELGCLHIKKIKKYGMTDFGGNGGSLEKYKLSLLTMSCHINEVTGTFPLLFRQLKTKGS